ncbi:MAG: serine hydrolase [Planctomycetota bacterium]
MGHRRLLSCATAAFLLIVSLAAQRPRFAAYHGADSATHASQVASLSAGGYRPISLSVGGTSSAPHYAAVWVKRSGSSFSMVQDKTPAEVQSWLQLIARSGYKPLKITVAGSGRNEVCAAIAINDPSLDRYARFGLTEAQLDSECASARTTGYRLADATVYGTTSAPRFAAVFEANPAAITWRHEFGDYYLDLQEKLDAHEEENVRIAHLTLSDGLQYLVIWQDDVILDADIELWDLSPAAYQAAFDTHTASGHLPICVQAAGPAALTRYAAVFTKTDLPAPRSMRKTGLAVPAFAAVDATIEQFMRSNGVRGTSVAIVKDGRLVYARAYTWAESNYPTIQPTSKFRLASLSKPVTAILVHDLEESGALDVATTKLNAPLGYWPLSPSYQQVTLQQALMHVSGIDRDNDDWQIANWVNPANPQLPVLPRHMARHGAEDMPMSYPVGQFYAYSNIAYSMLGRVVENVTGSQYGIAMQARVLNKLGIAPGRVHVGRSSKSGRHPGEVYYHQDDLLLRPSNLHTSRKPLARQYSGNVDRLDSTGGLVMAPVDFARILTGVFQLGHDNLVLERRTADRMLETHNYPTPSGGTFNISKGGFSWTQGGGVTTWRKGGRINGSSPDSIMRSDGVCLVVMSNRTKTDIPRSTLDALVNGVSSWPSHDLWPTVGLWSFPRSPALTRVVVNQLPRVTHAAFEIQGERLDQVGVVQFGSRQIATTDPANWATGYFTRVSATQIDVHPPQGLPPGTYPVTVTDAAQVTSNPIDVTVAATLAPVVRAQPLPTAPFAVFATLDPALSPATVALLTLSDSMVPSVAPGVVSLGLGNAFQSLWLWPVGVGFGRTGVATWTMPRLPAGTTVHLQVAQADPALPNPFPLSTSDVTTVTSGQ